MMLAMNPVEFAPLLCRKWPEDGMIHDAHIPTVASFNFANQLIESFQLWTDLCHDGFHRDSSWTNPFRSFSSFGKVSKSSHQRNPETLLESKCAGQGFPGFQTAPESFCAIHVGKIEMLENLRYTPLSLGSPYQGFLRHAIGGRENCVL